MLPIVLCPWCILQIIVLGAIVVPMFAFLGKVCKIRWADKAHTWCVTKIRSMAEAMKIIKKKEKEEEQPPCCECNVAGCEKRRE
jgi:hypothetical protein